MGKQLKQRWPKHDELLDILLDVKYGTPVLFQMAQIIFEEAVDPEPYHHEDVDQDQIIQCNMAFSEWSLFDFDLGDDMTPIKRAARRDPSLRDFAESQFYSIFWVISQDPETCVSRLRDVVTCEDFLVHDRHIAHNKRWSKGMLGTRIACVNGTWRTAGQVSLHDNAESEPLPHDGSANGHGIQNPSAFIGHLESVIGHNGEYRHSLEKGKLRVVDFAEE